MGKAQYSQILIKNSKESALYVKLQPKLMIYFKLTHLLACSQHFNEDSHQMSQTLACHYESKVWGKKRKGTNN